MAIKVTSATDAAQVWVDGARQRAGRYGANAPAAAQDWATNAAAAASTFKSAVSAPNIDKMFAGGIAKAGASKYQRKTAGVGKDRYPGGVAAAQADYASGVGPYLDTIKGVTLPAKKMRGDPGNLDRVKAIATALNAKRIALHGG